MYKIYLYTALICSFSFSPALANETSLQWPVFGDTAPGIIMSLTSIETSAGDAAETSAGDAAIQPSEEEVISYDLPAYAHDARISTGNIQIHTVGEEDTLLDIARHYKLGFVEIRAANPHIDAWSPIPGQKVTIPSFHLLPRTSQDGIVVNLSEMRLYYFEKGTDSPVTFPLGIGRDGLATPTGATTIIKKRANPTWYPTARMREDSPWLPVSIPAGTQNPLGAHALYLGWPTFLIHGSNKPWAIGRRVSSGCMRMYPEDIEALFNIVPVKTKVSVVNQPVLVGWVENDLYLEANPNKQQSNDIEITGSFEIEKLSDTLKNLITKTAGNSAVYINWDTVNQAINERRGYPILIAHKNTSL